MATTTEMTHVSAVMNRRVDPHNIYFVLSLTEQTLTAIFIVQVNKYFRIREWLNTHDD